MISSLWHTFKRSRCQCLMTFAAHDNVGNGRWAYAYHGPKEVFKSDDQITIAEPTFR